MNYDDEDFGPACLRCGGDMDWEDCTDGCDEGYWSPYEVNPNEYDPDELEACQVCNGKGGWWICVNSPEFCASEGAQRGTAEQPRWRDYR